MVVCISCKISWFVVVVVNSWLILFTLRCCCLHLGHKRSKQCNESENHIKQQQKNETENEMPDTAEFRISQKTSTSFWQIKDYRKQHSISEQVLLCVNGEKGVMYRNSIAGEEIKYFRIYSILYICINLCMYSYKYMAKSMEYEKNFLCCVTIFRKFSFYIVSFNLDKVISFKTELISILLYEVNFKRFKKYATKLKKPM